MTSPQSVTPLKPTDPFQPAAGARILSFGDYQPGNEVTNDDLAAMVDTTRRMDPQPGRYRQPPDRRT